jgi:hypothetical protein
MKTASDMGDIVKYLLRGGWIVLPPPMAVAITKGGYARNA